jgi:hypothetical protein|tara:strand:+ start:286 stop:723 length:438 start_codon:yes stop_codon:yes gene_type:complete
MVKIILRMNLADFILTSFEEDVINKLDEAYKDSIKFYLSLWYDDGDLQPKILKDFLLKYENRLHFKTNIKVGSELKTNDFIWFDIIRKSDTINSDRVRFQYTYSKGEYIINALEEFHKCAKFCTSEKPPKRIQKRNDNESSNYRK